MCVTIQESNRPEHVCARDEAVEDAFNFLRKCRGNEPEALAFDTWCYSKSVERDCVRELFGHMKGCRISKETKWRSYPEEDEKVVQEQYDTLVAVLESRNGKREIVFRVVYSADCVSPSVSYSAVMRNTGVCLNNVRCIGRSVYIEVGYVGDIVSGLAAARLLSYTPARNSVVDVLAGNPRRVVDWLYHQHASDVVSEGAVDVGAEQVELNEPQQAALNGLRTNVELVHGPPGTGKTRMVTNLITRFFAPNEAVVVSAVQNRAVEAVASHFISAGLPFVTFGRRLQGVCLQWTVEKQVERHGEVVARAVHLRRVSRARALLAAGLRYVESAIYRAPLVKEQSHRVRYREALVDRLVSHPSANGGFVGSAAYVAYLYEFNNRAHDPAALRKLRDVAEKYVASNVDGWSRLAASVTRSRYVRAYTMRDALDEQWERCAQALQTARTNARLEILGSARALLVTTASLGGAARSLKKLSARVKSIVIDEAGTVGDRHIVPVLVACPALDRVVFVGDTKQLPVFSSLRGSTAVSAMERLERSDIAPALLSVQYRMPPSLGGLVSRCFYDGALTSATTTDPQWPIAVRFRQVQSGKAERESEFSSSMRNRAEADEAVRVVYELLRAGGRSEDAGDQIAVLCTYAAQTRLIEQYLKTIVQSGAVEILNVDAAQGREWAHVVLTTVTSETRFARFLMDDRRLCVALSRAKKTLTLVATPTVVSHILPLSLVQTVAHREELRVDVLAERLAVSNVA